MFKNYWQMDDGELENEASKYKIQGYATSNGLVSRDAIIRQLLQKDNARYIAVSKFATILSVGAAIVTVILTAINIILSFSK